MRILLAEDDRELSRALKTLLERSGYSVETVFNGQDALDYALSSPYDGWIMDWMMPKLDGLSALRALRDKGIQTPCLILTAREAVEDRIRGLDAGADDYLPKPFAAGELLARVRAMLRRGSSWQSDLLHFGNVTLNRGGMLLACGEQSVRLTAKAFQTMDVLALDLEGNEWVRSTQKQVGLMRRMINDMVFLARADETAGHPQLAAVELTRVFREAAEPFALAAEAKGQTVRLETEENILVSGDEAELARMISVLCDNAVKYAPEGSTITVRLYRDRKYAVLETENLSQQPLEPEKLRHLFDRFYRGEEAHVRDGSYGIGLAIARAIAEKHGGMAMACMQGERICISCRVLCRRERHA